MTKTNFGLTLKNKALLGCGNLPQPTDNTGKRKSALIDTLRFERIPTANLKANDVSKTAHISTVNLSHHLTGKVLVKSNVNLQPQIEEVPKVDQTLSFLNNLLRKYRSASRARIGRETHLKDKKVIAKEGLNNYPSRALSKISRLALVGYVNKGAYSPLRAFFMRNIPMRSHIVMAKLWRDTFECAGFLYYLSTNLSQLCHPHLVVNGRASLKNKGVHTHA